MYIYQTVQFSGFCDAFRSYDRQDQFTYNGKQALFDYLEQLAEECDTPIELDVVALCCEYSEYSSAVEACQELIADDDYEREDITEDQAVDLLTGRTICLVFDGGVIVGEF